MKKTYIKPSFKAICLDTEESVLNNTSNLGFGDDIEDGQEVEGGSNRRGGIWGNTEW